MQFDTVSGRRQEIARQCEEHYRCHRREEDYRNRIVFEGFLVIFDCYMDLYPQYKTHEYLFELAAGDASSPHIPKIFDFFTQEDIKAYLVMEYIEPTLSPVPDLPQRAA